MSGFQNIKSFIERNKNNHESGYYNCIPFDVFPRFEKLVPGIIQGMQYILTGSSGCAKSKISRFMFLHHPYHYVEKHPELGIEVDIHYFSLEESREKIYLSELSRVLKTKHGLSVSVNQLRSIGKNNTIPRTLFSKIDECEKEVNVFMNKIKIYGKEESNPTGVYKTMRDVAHKTGKYFHKSGHLFTEYEMNQIKNSHGEIYKDIGGFKLNNPRHYIICLFDNINIMKGEKGLSEYECINKLSTDYFLDTKSMFKQINVIVQQQTAEKEKQEFTSRGQSIEEKLEPSKDGLAINKSTFNDAEFVLGIFNPARYGIKEHAGFDIQKLHDNYRSLSILKNRDDYEGYKIPLFFDGACDYFKELPRQKDNPNYQNQITEIYKYAKELYDSRQNNV